MTKYKHKYKQRLQEMATFIREQMEQARQEMKGPDGPAVYRAEGKYEILETLYEQLQLQENEDDDQARARRRHARDKRRVWCSECLWAGSRAEAVLGKPLKCPGCGSESLLPGEGPP